MLRVHWRRRIPGGSPSDSAEPMGRKPIATLNNYLDRLDRSTD